MDHAVGLVPLEHRRRRLLLERELPVGIVLEDPEAVLGRQLQHALALGGGQGATGWVMEVRDQVHELHGWTLERPLEGLDVDAVGLQRDADPLGAESLQEQQRAVVGRLLDDHPVARGNQVLEEQRAALQRSVGDHHLVDVGDAVALGDPLTQPRVPDARAVGERPLPVVGERPLRGLAHRIGGKDVGARGAACEADQLVGHLASIGTDPVCVRAPNRWAYALAPIASAASWAVSVGERPTRTPRASRASFFASAVPDDPEMIAPAWPIVLPGGAVKQAM